MPTLELEKGALSKYVASNQVRSGMENQDRNTVDGRNPAPKKPWNDVAPCKYQQTMISHGSKAVQDFVHPRYVLLDSSRR